MSSAKEAAVYCATECAMIRGTESTWSYFEDDGEFYVTATPDGEKIRIKTKRV